LRARFVILCLGRSGSSHLQSLLDSHSEVRCFRELFSDRVPAGAPGFVHSGFRDPCAYLDALFAGQEERVVGFKLPMNSIRATPETVGLLGADHEMLVVRLSRRNLLAQLVSRRLQATTRVSHSFEGDYGDTKISIDPRQALNALDRMEADELELDGYAHGKRVFRLAYEELAAGHRLEELQRFLGVEPEPLRSWFTKLRTRPLSETVGNWSELQQGLRDTRYERFLAERP
jgi:hypothetical protein